MATIQEWAAANPEKYAALKAKHAARYTPESTAIDTAKGIACCIVYFGFWAIVIIGLIELAAYIL